VPCSARWVGVGVDSTLHCNGVVVNSTLHCNGVVVNSTLHCNGVVVNSTNLLTEPDPEVPGLPQPTVLAYSALGLW